MTIAFWTLVAQEELAAAKQMAIKGSMDGISLGKLKQFEVGEQEINGITAIVPTVLISEKAGKEEKLIFNTALAQVNGVWKIDFRKTMTNMIGINIQNTIENLGKAMEKGIAQPLEKGAVEIGRALERGMKELGTAIKGSKQELIEGRSQHAKENRKLADMAFENKDYRTALKEYKLAAEEDVHSQYMVAFLYSMNFKGIGEDYEQAFLWASIAATNGYENAILLKKMLSKDIPPNRIPEIEALAKRCSDQKDKNCNFHKKKEPTLQGWKKTTVIELSNYISKRILIRTTDGIVREGILSKANNASLTIRQGRIGSNLTFKIPYANIATIKVWR